MRDVHKTAFILLLTAVASITDAQSVPTTLATSEPGRGEIGLRFVVGEDGNAVLFTAESNTAERELAVVDRLTGNVEVLTSDDGNDFDVVDGSMIFANDRAVYLSERADTRDAGDLFTVSTAGASSPQKLNPATGVDYSISSFPQFDPASDRVVYRADQNQAGFNELFSVSLEEPFSTIRINGSLPFVEPTLTGVTEFEVLTDSRVLYQGLQGADEENAVVSTLWLASATGSPAARLIDGGVNGSTTRSVESISPSPDGTRVAYIVGERTAGASERVVLMLSDLRLTDPSVELTDAFLPLSVFSIQFSPRSDELLVVGRTAATPSFQLFRQPLAESSPTLLTSGFPSTSILPLMSAREPIVTFAEGSILDPAIKRVNIDDIETLTLVPQDSGRGQLFDMRFSQDEQRLILVSSDGFNPRRLFEVDVATNETTKIFDRTVGSFTGAGWQVSEDGSTFVFAADDESGNRALYLLDLGDNPGFSAFIVR